MADPTSLAQGHPAEVWAALIATITACLGLMSKIWRMTTKEMEKQSERLEKGAEKFEKQTLALSEVRSEIEALRKEDLGEIRRLDATEAHLKDLERRLTVIETEHKACQEAVKAMQYLRTQIRIPID